MMTFVLVALAFVIGCAVGALIVHLIVRHRYGRLTVAAVYTRSIQSALKGE